MSSLKGGRYLDNRRDGRFTEYRNRLRGRGYIKTTRVSKRAEYTGNCECLECGNRLLTLQSHLRHVHCLTTSEYREKHGAGTPVMDDSFKRRTKSILIGKALPAQIKAKRSRFTRQAETTCAVCGVAYCQVPWARKNKVCSDDCVRKLFSAERSGNPKYVAAARINSGAPSRVAWVEQLKAGKIKDRSRICVVCGKPWISGRRSAAIRLGVCSFKCRSIAERKTWEAMHPQIQCRMCGDSFQPVVSGHRRKFCSKACYKRAMTEDPETRDRRLAVSTKALASVKHPATSDPVTGRFVSSR